ncbi:hypothetical protein [Rhodovulum adriaticum]|uniref:Sulfotransferase domain-containing protein n=1 Tax=Rhodovulum adriaticum TaxID=35804 RepID=A0A4V2SMF6_RHOAD|nr:hypothetical protein [Rhodovulum adriaticum]MBK1637220.1 hypothetical protein [Rhodovulum adriaticum]TCP27106.1 hypothetical protein EV656_1018 [Rhodovulum adriaticum]
MVSYVVSAPRSGMNWLRFCVEHFYGVRTPGKTSLIDRQDDPSVAFLRSHDALNWTRKREVGLWRYIDPAGTANDRVALVLRDPLETYVRMSKKSLLRFRCYVSNIRFYSDAVSPQKRVFYYDDLVAQPVAMLELMQFLDIAPAPGRTAPSLDRVRAEWDELGARSRAQYDVRQAVGGGSKTRENPTDFRYHQRALTDWHRDRAWRFLQRRLRPDEMALLARYGPPAPMRRPLLSYVTDLY